MRRLLFLPLVLFLFGFQEPYDEENQPAQPSTCNNYVSNVHKCMCSRAMMACKLPGEQISPDQGENRCLTTCRPKACMCKGPACTSRR